MRFPGILLCAFLMAAVSCGAPRNVSYVPAGSIQELALIEPCGDIIVAGADGFAFSPSLSVLASNLVCTALLDTRVPIGKTIPMSYSGGSSALFEWMLGLAEVAPSRASGIQVPEELRATVINTGIPFGMAILIKGYAGDGLKRTKPYDTQCYSVVFDAISGQVVRFDRICRNEYDPASYFHMKKMVKRLFRGFR